MDGWPVEGDDEFEAFYVGSYHRVVRIARRLVHDFDEAEDIAQEAFARCYPRWAEVRLYEEPTAWVAVVATNLACSRLRRVKVAAKRPGQLTADSIPHGVQVEERVDVVRALKMVPVHQRIALVMYYVGDFSVKDIAARTASSENAVKVNLHRGRIRLAKELGVVHR